MIGTFGNIVFETGSRRILTFEEMKRQSKSDFAAHAIIGKKPVLEHTGPGLEEISFQIRLDVSLGIDPEQEINKLRKILLSGKEQTLILGGWPKQKFVLTELGESWKKLDHKGRLIVAVLDLKLLENAHE